MLSEWMHRLTGWLVVPTMIPLVVVGMESMSLRIQLELWVLALTTETAGTRPREPAAGALSSDPLVVLLLSSDGGVKPEAMLTRDLTLLSLMSW